MQAFVAFYPYTEQADRLQIYFDAADMMAKLPGLHNRHRRQELSVDFVRISRHEIQIRVHKHGTRAISFVPRKRGDRFMIETNASLHESVKVIQPTKMTAVEATLDDNDVIVIPLPAKPLAPSRQCRGSRKAEKPSDALVECMLGEHIISLPKAVVDFILRQHGG